MRSVLVSDRTLTEIATVEQRFIQDEIARSAYQYQRSIEKKERIIVGVNDFVVDEPAFDKHFTVDDSIRKIQSERLAELRLRRDNLTSMQSLENIRASVVDGVNIMPSVINAVESHCTLGEISDVLRKIYGEYQG